MIKKESFLDLIEKARRLNNSVQFTEDFLNNKRKNNYNNGLNEAFDLFIRIVDEYESDFDYDSFIEDISSEMKMAVFNHDNKKILELKEIKDRVNKYMKEN